MWNMAQLFESAKISLFDPTLGVHISDEQLKEKLYDAIGIYLDLKYPAGNIPIDDNAIPQLDFRAQRWIVQATVELASRQGFQGQTTHNENSINRSFDSGSISLGLIRQITPVISTDSSIDTRMRVVIPYI